MIKDKEYISSMNQYNKPEELEGQQAIGLRLMELIMMNPGDNPLHPDMGVGLRNYRYGINTTSDLEQRIYQQINDYLPMYRATDIALVVSPDKTLSVEIVVGDTTYVYDSAEGVPITLDDVSSN